MIFKEKTATIIMTKDIFKSVSQKYERRRVKMSISSVNNTSSALLLSLYANSGTKSSKSSEESSQSSTSALSGVVASNSDGDTFQLSDAAKSSMVSASEMFSKMDTDGDGSLSETEFTSARPSDVSEEMAANLYSTIDSDSSSSLTESEFAAMDNMPPPPPSSTSSDSGSSTDSQSFSELDTNQDGVVSADELAAARPEDVSEEMAANLFNSLDQDGSGGLTESEYATAMGGNAGVTSV